jgi:hypothetical protein
VTEWLLSALSRRLNFAAEMGVVACFEYPPDRYAGFVEAHVTKPVRALAEVLRIAAADADAPAGAEPLEGVTQWAEVLAAEMLTLGRFRSLTRAECDDSANRFTGAWAELRRCIEELSAALGVEVSYLRDMPPECEQAVRNILDGLCAEILAEAGRRAP